MTLAFQVWVSLALLIVGGAAVRMVWQAGQVLWGALNGAPVDATLPTGLAAALLVLGVGLVPLISWVLWATWWYGGAGPSSQDHFNAGGG